MTIAVDFDHTLADTDATKIYSPNTKLINCLIDRRKQGDKLILWTCREGERLREAVEWSKRYGLEFDAVNSNIPEMIEWYGNDTRKIGYDVLIDDKAVNKPKYNVPYRKEKYV